MIRILLEVGWCLLGWILLISTIFFIATYLIFANCQNALTFSLDLFTGLLTAISTLGAVWAAIYALSDKIPKLYFECVNWRSEYNPMLKKNIHTIQIRIKNIGHQAFFFIVNLSPKDKLGQHSCDINPKYGFDVIHFIDDEIEPYCLDLSITESSDDELLALVDTLKIELEFSYKDKFHNTYNHIYKLHTRKKLIELTMVK